MRGFDVTIKIGINADSKDEAKKTAEEWIKSMDCPVWIVNIE